MFWLRAMVFEPFRNWMVFGYFALQKHFKTTVFKTKIQ